METGTVSKRQELNQTVKKYIHFSFLSPRKENTDTLCWDIKTQKSLPMGTSMLKKHVTDYQGPAT